MSHGNEYPLLSATSYERPATPVTTNIMHQDAPQTPPAVNHLVTPPETPMRRMISNESLKPSSTATSTVTEVSLTSSDIQAMNDVLAQARQAGEFPRTTSSPMNAQAVVEDYGFLTRLRETRGKASTPTPETYNHLLVEITRRIRERDSALNEEETKREAARRVNNYLRSIEQERFIFDAATASHKGSSCASSQASVVDAEELGEQLLSIFERAADQTMVDAMEPLCVNLRNQIAVHGQRNDIHGQHNDIHGQHNVGYDHRLNLHQQLLQNQEDINNALRSLIGPHSQLLQASSESLSMMSGLSTHFSNVVMNLPGAVNQVVSAVVQQHVQTAIRQVMDAQQRAMLALVEEEIRQKQFSHELLAAKVAERLQQKQSSVKCRSKGKGLGWLKRALRKIIKG